MTFGKILGYIGWTILIVITVFAILIWRACNNGDLYQAGSGLGSVTTVENYKYQQNFYEKYADSFLIKFPQYKVPKDDPSSYMTSGYEFLNMTKFYFDKSPKEIYCVQWQGIDVRMAYSVDRNEMIIENPRNNVYIDKSEKERMSKRLRTEVIDKIDSLIANSVDKDSALLKRF
ncbi:MAG: hypothetical protein JST10_06910 [Bacteroidetes bacterium]|nr:hypothetical protein [Bacteroidota bacterium]